MDSKECVWVDRQCSNYIGDPLSVINKLWNGTWIRWRICKTSRRSGRRPIANANIVKSIEWSLRWKTRLFTKVLSNSHICFLVYFKWTNVGLCFASSPYRRLLHSNYVETEWYRKGRRKTNNKNETYWRKARMSFRTTSANEAKNSRKGVPRSFAALAASPNVTQTKMTPSRQKQTLVIASNKRFQCGIKWQ